MFVEVKSGHKSYKCSGCNKMISKGESHFKNDSVRPSASKPRFHATCVDKTKVVKSDKPAKAVKAPKAPKAAKPAKNGKNVKSKTVKAKAPKAGVPAIDLEPDTTADAEEDADEAAADAAALAAAIAGEAEEPGPKVAE
jgi:hypothetical protein